ncbi:jg21197 [Pararge aegeria aegeria]|uniref:Jg21197 protein n=1 Tax=Pararge aegeria aegeria TaxID=348720 RepID=A0A8S4RB59_9NEOP|nr:jg21197 [Pararge aegeria aegeria]
MAEYLAAIFGTEKDKVNCSFYFKIGACRHGDRCSRIHNKPTFSQTVLLQNLEEDAEKAVNDLNNRWFGGRPVYAELSPVTDFREACCRQYEMGECTRSGFCNFMHLKPISRELRRYLYARRKGGRKSRSRSRERRRRSRSRERRGREPPRNSRSGRY